VKIRVTVLKDGAEKTCELDAGVAAGGDLLSTLEAAGAVLPYGCRAGACGACAVQVTRGGEALEARSPIEIDTLSRGAGSGPDARLACRARWRVDHAVTELRVEVPLPAAGESDWPY
jgi:ferredoxin